MSRAPSGWRSRRARCSTSIRRPRAPAFEEINLRKRPVRARTAGAGRLYPGAASATTLVFGVGPAGTGKTWLAVAHAVALFERKEVDRIILSRPAVEAGERLGFLPGDMREKVDPYLRPIYDALYDLMDARIVERAMQTGEIEIAPLAFMRGRTLSNAVVILDEAQNTTSMQMKMFLTRLGENSRMIVTGDPSQIDLPSGQTSGLAEAMRLLADVEGVGHVTFTADDVVRHELVARIVEAYDKADATLARARGLANERRIEPRAASIDVIVECGRSGTRPHGASTVRAAVSRCGRCRRRRHAASGRAAHRALTDDAGDPRAQRATGAASTSRPTCCRFPAAAARGRRTSLGDIVDRLRDHRARGASPKASRSPHHLAHLAVHGFLHLLGYDHDNDARRRARWSGSSARILAAARCADPVLPRATTSRAAAPNPG